MIIAIGGLTGSGKNTLGVAIAEEFNLKLVCPTFKDLAKNEGISLMEFQKKAAKDPGIDLKFDELLKKDTENGNCVVTTWLGAWMVNADLRIFLSATESVRANRIAKRDKMELSKALKHVKERDKQNKMRYKKLYGIDIDDLSIFDLVINSENFSKGQINDIVKNTIKIKKLE